MKKKYTKKQIIESIKHWQKVLESMEVTKEDEEITSVYRLDRLHDYEKHTLYLDIVTEKYDKKGNFIGEMTKEEVDKYIAEIAKKYHLTATVDSYHGSGGGWPDVAFTGLKKDLKRMYQQWYCRGDVEGKTCERFNDYFKEFSKPA